MVQNPMIECAYRHAKFQDLPDGRICYVRQGTGPTVMLLHGAPLSLLTWRNNIDTLARQFDVIAPDMKGFGFSQKGPGDYSPEGQAQFVVQLLEHLSIAQISVIGSSYGCAVAFTLALNYPNKVDKLILINSVGYPSGPHSLEKLVRIGILRRIIQPTLKSKLIGANILSARLRRSYAKSGTFNTTLAEAYFSLLQHDSGASSFLACLEGLSEESIATRLGSIKNNTLILWGKKDEVLPVRHAYQFQREIPNATLEVLPDCGHFPHEENAEDVNEHVIKFLRMSSHTTSVLA